MCHGVLAESWEQCEGKNKGWIDQQSSRNESAQKMHGLPEPEMNEGEIHYHCHRGCRLERQGHLPEHYSLRLQPSIIPSIPALGASDVVRTLLRFNAYIRHACSVPPRELHQLQATGDHWVDSIISHAPSCPPFFLWNAHCDRCLAFRPRACRLRLHIPRMMARVSCF